MNHIVIKPAFKIIGIAVETTNKNMQAVQDIGALWKRFTQEEILNKIPQKISTDIYEVFTDYVGNYEAPYRTILGCMVETSAQVPDGMIEKNIPEQTYCVYLAKGKMPDAIGATWANIWQDDAKLNRAYLADFDIYTPRAYDPHNAEVEILVGIKKEHSLLEGK